MFDVNGWHYYDLIQFVRNNREMFMVCVKSTGVSKQMYEEAFAQGKMQTNGRSKNRLLTQVAVNGLDRPRQRYSLDGVFAEAMQFLFMCSW